MTGKTIVINASEIDKDLLLKIDNLEAKLLKSEATNAEMRAILIELNFRLGKLANDSAYEGFGFKEPHNVLQRTLSSSAGKDLLEKMEKMKAELGFYANKENWIKLVDGKTNEQFGWEGVDGGDRARKALTELEGK